MFTGIIEETGRITAAQPRSNGVELDIEARHVLDDLRPGASIAVAGVCQTVLEVKSTGFRVAAEQETLRVTTLGTLGPGARVNLERAIPAGGRLDGHVVLGHVDGRGRIVSRRDEARTHVLGLEVPEDLWPYVVPKGCIAVDGVSLTVGPQVQAGSFELFLIPYTWEKTALCEVGPGSHVNVETDILGRYIGHWLATTREGAFSGRTP